MSVMRTNRLLPYEELIRSKLDEKDDQNQEVDDDNTA